jgi:hypothetical protein
MIVLAEVSASKQRKHGWLKMPETGIVKADAFISLFFTKMLYSNLLILLNS